MSEGYDDPVNGAEVIGALLIACLLAIGVLLLTHWDHVRCWLPEVKTVPVSGQGSPTLIDE